MLCRSAVPPPASPTLLEAESIGEDRYRMLAPFSSGKRLAATRRALHDYCEAIDGGILLHPTEAKSVPIVLRAWQDTLGAKSASPHPFGHHGEYIGLEIADYFEDFRPFLEQERMLWESVAVLTGSHTARDRLRRVSEVRRIGGRITSQMRANIRSGAKSSAAFIRALEVMGVELLVSEKTHDIGDVLRSLD